MTRIFNMCEGESESVFTRDVLGPYLAEYGIYMTPIQVQTKRVSDGRKFTGGLTRFDRFENDFRRHAHDSNVRLITMQVDLYRLPTDFPGYAESFRLDYVRRTMLLETALRERIGDPRFLPYFSTHDFEALIVGFPQHVERVCPCGTSAESSIIRVDIDPESVNDADPPANRIMRAHPGYRKSLHGPQIAMHVGMTEIRRRCKRFDAWVGAIIASASA